MGYYLIAALYAVNTFLLVGIAGSLVKLLKHLKQEEDLNGEWDIMLKNRQISNPKIRSPNYPELNSTNSIESKNQNWDGLPRVERNWDGIPNQGTFE